MKNKRQATFIDRVLPIGVLLLVLLALGAFLWEDLRTEAALAEGEERARQNATLSYARSASSALADGERILAYHLVKEGEESAVLAGEGKAAELFAVSAEKILAGGDDGTVAALLDGYAASGVTYAEYEYGECQTAASLFSFASLSNEEE